jgi:hypothetical protein
VHDHIESADNYDNCRDCDCAEVKDMGRHCAHCYHCPQCSTAVAMECRPCIFSPDKSIYPCYIYRKRKGQDPDSTVDLEEWYSICSGFPASLNINPVTPILSDGEEDVIADEAQSKEASSDTSQQQEHVHDVE